MIDLIALSAAKKHADLLAMGLTSVSVDNTNKSITFTLAADGSQHTIYFDQPSDGVSIIGVEIKNGHLICLMSDGSEIDAGVLPSGGSSGSSGSNVQPDWSQNDSAAPDYIKNRPFYTGDPVETVFVEETTAPFVDTKHGFYMAEVASTFVAAVGETYKVSWDGATYECACVDFNNMPAIGNFSIVGAGTDTGEPFLIVIANGPNDQGIQIATADTSASHTFSISGIVAQIVKIDDKYLAISETIDLSSLSEWTGEQKQNLYDKFKSGKVLLAKNIPYVDGLFTITYVNYDNKYSIFEINAIGDNYACNFYGNSWDKFELSDSNVQKRIDNTLNSKTSWNLYSANATGVDIGEPIIIRLQCVQGKPVFYFESKGNPGVIMEYKYPFLQKGTELEIGSSTKSSSKVFKIIVDDNSFLKVVNTSDSSEVTMAKTSDIPTDDHINELISNALSTIGIAEEGAY